MNAEDLRALQAPLKDRYRAEPAAAKVTLKARGALDETSIACKVETGRAHRRGGAASGDRRRRPRTLFGRHAARGAGRLRRRDAEGGRDRDRRANPLRRGSAPRATSTSAARSASPRTRRSASRDIRLTFDLDTDAPQDKLDTLLKLTERYCVVLQTLKRPPAIAATLTRAEA